MVEPPVAKFTPCRKLVPMESKYAEIDGKPSISAVRTNIDDKLILKLAQIGI